MHSLSQTNLLLVLLSLAVVLAVARAAGELARRLHQPEVLGELFAGVLIGPSVLGVALPGVERALFLEPAVGVVLSGMSWLGAVLVLMMAGREVEVPVVRAEALPGALSASLAIGASFAAGALLGGSIGLHGGGVFLGVVLSVTGVSVTAKLLAERQVMRRRHAQVALAAGMASEVVGWILVSVVLSAKGASPVAGAVVATGTAVVLLVAMLTIGRRFVFWAMRRVSDSTGMAYGQLSLVLVLAFVAAAVTQALGLHALLGPFLFGVLLGRSPRARQALSDRLSALTLGFGAPVFFTLAGMSVHLSKIASTQALIGVAVLAVVATVVKVGFAMIGARLGRLRWLEAALVGVGLNVKGGTDVIVAILGHQLGLLSGEGYAMYAVVAVVTVLATPTAMSLIEKRVPPSGEEARRMEVHEAERRGYVSGLERVIVPMWPELKPSLVLDVIEQIAMAQHDRDRIVDLTRLNAGAVETDLPGLSALPNVEMSDRKVRSGREIDDLLAAGGDHDLIAMGAERSGRGASLGRQQDEVLRRAPVDVLVAIGEGRHLPWSNTRRVLVPTNGLEHSMAAADVAGYLAESSGAELVLLSVVGEGHIAGSVADEADGADGAGGADGADGAGGADEAGGAGPVDHGLGIGRVAGGFDELIFRISRLGVKVSERVRVGESVVGQVLAELGTGSYDLVVFGVLQRAREGVYLGSVFRAVLTGSNVPMVVLVSKQRPLEPSNASSRPA